MIGPDKDLGTVLGGGTALEIEINTLVETRAEAERGDKDPGLCQETEGVG